MNQPVTTTTLPAMPPVTPRRPYIDDEPDGYLESDRDMAENNSEAVLWFLENHELIRQALAQRVLLPLETPVFEQSGKFVRGPSRPSGSGFKQMVLPMRSEKDAALTTENLNELFAVYAANR